MPAQTQSPAVQLADASSTSHDRLDVRTRTALVAILALGTLLRLAYLAFLMTRPGFGWSDPDGYVAVGAQMARGGWHWTDDAVVYLQFVKAPLYTVILSWVALAPLYPLSAALSQILLSAVGGGAAFFSIGRTLHSVRAGLIAAAVGTCCLLGLNGASTFMQEGVAVPLALMAMAVLLRGVATAASPRVFAATGGFFGVVALVRSMPVYFVPPAALAYLAMSRPRGAAARRALALLAGFVVVILPYSVFISAHRHHAILIDDQGSRAVVMRYSSQPLTEVPGLAGSVRMLAENFARSPGDFLRERWSMCRAMFLLRGGHAIQVGIPAAQTAAGAVIWKLLVHLTSDLPSALIALCAPFGFVLARNRRASALLALWVVVNLVLMITFLWGGARYRTSFESQALVAAAVVLAGGWKRPAWWGITAAGVTCLVLAAIVVPSVPTVLAARAPYGIAPWQEINTTNVTHLAGSGGFTIRRFQPAIKLTLRVPPRGAATAVEVRLDGRLLWKSRVQSQEPAIVRYPFPPRLSTFVEIRATDVRTGLAAPIEVELHQPR